ncbi:hypothetical protein GWE18_14590 [Bradyrhizobium sp. CSA112]|uniref:hypothetical protein n=1 Tax=Bradyrhizobium sp. CSA112 TaxID=2699170 RepID=UPI0023B1DAFF|nr:hypothetical protein [Bradyrhizobium sp. CSA112]MDE5454069.1 hypothetical protein [Bradyrhizobium sp. CSA112]
MAVGLPPGRTLIDHLLKELELGPEVIDGMNDGYQMLAEFYRLKQGGMGSLAGSITTANGSTFDVGGQPISPQAIGPLAKVER